MHLTVTPRWAPEPAGPRGDLGGPSERGFIPRERKTGAEDVAVIVVNWNSAGLLDECLSALVKQTHKPKRVFVVDNASTDGSTSGLAERHPGIALIQLGHNAGFAAANNSAARMAEDCQWIALLNPDAVPEPTWLERLIAAARANPDFSFFASRLVLAGDTDRLDGAGDVYAVNGLAWRRHHGGSVTTTALVPEEVFSACAAAALYHRDAFLEAGGFDESYFCYFEDVDLAFRLRLAGHRCLYLPDAVARHVGSALTGRRSDFCLYHGHRNLVWTYVKNMPALLFAAYLPHHILLNVVSVAWFSFHGRGRIIFRAKWDALWGLPRACRQRRHIQAGRKIGLRDLRRSMAGGFWLPYFRGNASDDRVTGATVPVRVSPHPAPADGR